MALVFDVFEIPESVINADPEAWHLHDGLKEQMGAESYTRAVGR